MNNMSIEEAFKVYFPGDDNNAKDKRGAKGIIEFVVKDRNGNIVSRRVEPNIVKIFAKEMLSHRLPSSQVWDPTANTGSGAWVDIDLDADEEFAARYILFGASFDSDGVPLDAADTRYYITDPLTGAPTPVRLGPGAEYEGSLVNAIPLAEPDRPLKRVEDVSFLATFQPGGSPLRQADVRGMNNIVVLSTTLRLSEYNGFGQTNSDFFTITEVALCGGKKFDAIGVCECTPRNLFLHGSSDGDGLRCLSDGSDIITIDGSESEVDLIKQGDQIKIMSPGGTASGGTANPDTEIGQITPYYLVMEKSEGGREIKLDRTVVDSNNDPIIGTVAVWRDTLRIFSHRILSVPLKKSSDFEIIVSWHIIMN